MTKDDFDRVSLEYHRAHPPGKLEITATKPLANQRDLAMAYSPGVAAPCMEISKDPATAAYYTSRANLVAVITNGTAVLGLGEIGPLASKPVMEGKAVLFKKFSGIDVFDLEINENDPERLVDIIASLEPTFGGINLEDIKAPECFVVERMLKERLSIPVFHDDQHGTAIIVGAAMVNALGLIDKDISDIRLVATGAGAASLACLDLLVSLGMRRESITIVDLDGVVYSGREQMDPYKERYARDTDWRTLEDAIDGADVFLGLSGPGVLKPHLLKLMARDPIIFALANPVPEILPELAREARDDAIIATGRSDYPNQVNNVLCFPYIFRGALDVGATAINEEMKLACVYALANLAKAESSDVADLAYSGQATSFGRDYLIPRPFDPRLVTELAPAVVRAAMKTGVATRPIEDFPRYRQRLSEFVFRSGLVMKPVFDRARETNRKLIYAEGEDRRVLQAVQQVVDESLARPILVGRPRVIHNRIRELGLRIREDTHFDLINIHDDPRFFAYWSEYHRIMGRRGVTPEVAKKNVSSVNTVVAAIAMQLGDADAMLCGGVGHFQSHVKNVTEILGKAQGVIDFSSVTALVLPSGTFFICDTHITPNPGPEELAEMTLLAASEVRRFGIEPKVALLSHSNFGSHDDPSALKVRRAMEILNERAPELEVDGEMHADAALSDNIRERAILNSTLTGKANLLIMPNLDASHIGYNLLKMLGGGVSIGPILIGTPYPAHILTNSVTVRGIFNMSAIACVS
ncbi:MAG: malic protein NAD-binding protein [marine bacterium B5-7]|nr:MAG: malic protein NAD-binding protein [marine bacterium B5-7]